MAFCTLALVSGVTDGWSLMTRDTVIGATPASLATSAITGERPHVRPEHAYHVIEIIEKGRIAGKTGQAQTIESTFTPPTFFTQEEEAEAAHLKHDRTN